MATGRSWHRRVLAGDRYKSRVSDCIFAKENASGSGQESLDGRPALSLRGINLCDFAEPYSGEIHGRPDQERETLLGSGFLNLLVEFACFSGQVSSHVQQYQIIHIGLPEKSRTGEILGRVYLDTMIL